MIKLGLSSQGVQEEHWAVPILYVVIIDMAAVIGLDTISFLSDSCEGFMFVKLHNSVYPFNKISALSCICNI